MLCFSSYQRPICVTKKTTLLELVCICIAEPLNHWPTRHVNPFVDSKVVQTLVCFYHLGGARQFESRSEWNRNLHTIFRALCVQHWRICFRSVMCMKMLMELAAVFVHHSLPFPKTKKSIKMAQKVSKLATQDHGGATKVVINNHKTRDAHKARECSRNNTPHISFRFFAWVIN